MIQTLEEASWAGRSEIAVGMAGVAYRETAHKHSLNGKVYPCGESLSNLSVMQMKPTTLHMQTMSSEGR